MPCWRLGVGRVSLEGAQQSILSLCVPCPALRTVLCAPCAVCRAMCCAQAVRKVDLEATQQNTGRRRNPMEDLKREIMIM